MLDPDSGERGDHAFVVVAALLPALEISPAHALIKPDQRQEPAPWERVERGIRRLRAHPE